jgi:hypothetical protein
MALKAEGIMKPGLLAIGLALLLAMTTVCSARQQCNQARKTSVQSNPCPHPPPAKKAKND